MLFMVVLQVVAAKAIVGKKAMKDNTELNFNKFFMLFFLIYNAFTVPDIIVARAHEPNNIAAPINV